MVDLDYLIRELPELRKQFQTVDKRAKEAIARANESQDRATRDADEADRVLAERASLLKIIEGLEGLAPRTAVPTTNATATVSSLDPATRIRGREAVRRILRELGGPVRQRDLIAEVKKRGWIDPDARDPSSAIRVSARRLVDDGEVEKISTGLYRYKFPSGTPNGAAAEVSAASQGRLLAEEGGDE